MLFQHIRLKFFILTVIVMAGGCSTVSEREMTKRWFWETGDVVFDEVKRKGLNNVLVGYRDKLHRKQTLEVKKTLMRQAYLLYQENPENRMAALNALRSLFLVVDVIEDKKSSYYLSGKGLKISLKAGAGIDPEVSYYHALFLGMVIREKGLMALGRLKEVVKMLEVARSKPELDFGGPLRVSGMLYLKAPPWPQGIGDLDKSLDALQKAVEKFPEFPQNKIFLAEAFIEDEDTEKAKGLLNEVEKELKITLWGKDYCSIWKKYIKNLRKKINQN